ncbi:uncharacterized protein LOC142231708 isoform X2 [Haematobia irritans]|uniref:uncharacterized protein LOC142231708 isoform X2 n=1 Tax=Haematobia irritans TaxID=7368 RepID=UPI003F502A9A
MIRSCGSLLSTLQCTYGSCVYTGSVSLTPIQKLLFQISISSLCSQFGCFLLHDMCTTMSGTNSCFLCRNACNDSIRLRDAQGCTNEIYNITTKYFDPKYLKINVGSVNSIQVLCMECWRHISSFNNFRNSILLMLDNLLNVEYQDDIVKEEFIVNEDPPDIITIPDDGHNDDEPRSCRSDLLHATNSVGEYSIEYTANGFHNDQSVGSQENESIDLDNDDDNFESGDVFVVDEFDQDDEWDSSDQRKSLYSFGRLIQRSRERRVKKSGSELDAIIAKWKPLLDCYVCSEKFPNFVAVKVHFEKEHPNDVFYIECCGRKIRYRFRFQEHASIHLNPVEFQCKYCAKCFTSQSTLDGHVNYCKSKGTDASFTSTRTCPFCYRVFNYRTGVYQHVRRHHPVEFEKRNKRPSSKI